MIKNRVEKNSFEDLDMDSTDESLLRASGVTGSMTMFSRVLGLIRDIVIARIFGVTDAADAFFLANKIPNFLRRLFAEGLSIKHLFQCFLSTGQKSRTLKFLS